MRVVLDSNVLLVSIGRRSQYRPIWSAFVTGLYQLVISNEVLSEYEEILQQYSAPGAAEIVLEIFTESPDVIFQQVYYNWNMIKNDPEDNKFFDIAVAAGVDYLVTNDAHFDIAKSLTFPAIKIITADEFLKLL